MCPSRAVYVGSSYGAQEKCFLQMIDCVQELHTKGEFHRDIKPQNFLVEGEQIVVSDFGLSMEIGSNTAFTRSSVFWGDPRLYTSGIYAWRFQACGCDGRHLYARQDYVRYLDRS